MSSSRIVSIDIMRGLTLFLMLFVNDLFMPGVPKWLGHTAAQYDGMGLADWVFPGFLFMVGMAIPFANAIKKLKGEDDVSFFKHVVTRSLSLIIIGVLTVNIGRLNPDMTGMPTYIWALSVYVCIFLIWNDYRLCSLSIRKYAVGFRIVGIIGLAVLVYLFKAGTPEYPEWLIHSWWGILGLIGWSYFVGSIVFLVVKSRLSASLLIWLSFVGLNAADLSGYTEFLAPMKAHFGVVLGGNTPSIVLAGLFAGLLLQKLKEKPDQLIKIFTGLGVICIVTGFILRHWYIISKIMATPSWGMICTGISFLVFILLYWIIDVKGYQKGFDIFNTAGQNSLTTYLAPDILYFIIWTFGFSILIYKQSSSPLIVILGSLLWAYLMIIWTSWLAKHGIKLKL